MNHSNTHQISYLGYFVWHKIQPPPSTNIHNSKYSPYGMMTTSFWTAAFTMNSTWSWQPATDRNVKVNQTLMKARKTQCHAKTIGNTQTNVIQKTEANLDISQRRETWGNRRVWQEMEKYTWNMTMSGNDRRPITVWLTNTRPAYRCVGPEYTTS